MSVNNTNSSSSYPRYSVGSGEDETKGKKASPSKSISVSPPKLELPQEDSATSLAGRVTVNQAETMADTSPKVDEQEELPPPAARIDDQDDIPEEEPEIPSKMSLFKAKLRERLESMEISVAQRHSYHRLLESGLCSILEYILDRQHSWKDDNKIIDSLPLSEIAQIILDTKNAIVEYVTSKIPENSDKEVCFLIGIARSGKSTSLCYLCGDTMKHLVNDRDKFTSEEHPELIARSQISTYLPNIEEARGVHFVDFPYLDSGPMLLFEIGLQSAFKSLIDIYHPKILIIQETPCGGCYIPADIKWKDILDGLIGKENVKRSVLCITKRSYPELTQEQEKKAIETLGIPNYCFLKDLERPDERESCFQTLKAAERVHSAPGIVSTSSQYILTQALQEKIIATINSMTAIWKTQEDFWNEYHKNGFISAALSSSHPELFELLSLPGIDPETINSIDSMVEFKCKDKIYDLLQYTDSFLRGGE